MRGAAWLASPGGGAAAAALLASLAIFTPAAASLQGAAGPPRGFRDREGLHERGRVGGGGPPLVASLLREGGLRSRRWDWKSASEESLTEWSIVLRRYYMVDMELGDLMRRFGEVLPPPEGAKQEELKPDDVARIRSKVDKLSANLEAALADQRVSDGTFGNMEVDKKLSPKQKQALFDEHKEEWHKAQELAELGRAARGRSQELLAEVGRHQRDSSDKSMAPRLFEQFKAATTQFQERRAVFEHGMQASSARLLALKGRVSKAAAPPAGG